MIKVIETEYDGYKFRSRLEARWAFFFNECGIPFEYEKEVYEIRGKQYIPKFYLPWFKCFVEIKPKAKDNYEESEMILKSMCAFHGDCITMLCKGDPLDNDMTVYCLDEKDGSIAMEPQEWSGAMFLEGVEFEYGGCTRHHISLCVDGGSSLRVFMDSSYNPARILNIHGMEYFRSDFFIQKVMARQARF